MRRIRFLIPASRLPIGRTAARFLFCVFVLATSVATAAAKGDVATAASPDLTLSFDSDPYLSDFDTVMTGYRCGSSGKVAFTLAGRSQSPDQAFVRDGVIRRDGAYSAHVFLHPGDFSSYSCKKEAAVVRKGLGDGEGSEAWYAWSWRFPTTWTGTDSWGTLLEFATNHVFWPSYGQLTFDAAIADRLRMQVKTGHIPSPGASDFNPTPPNGYKATVTLLGPATVAPRPFTLGVWHDFYMHIIWRSRSSGVLTIWHRQESGFWEKLYDNTGAQDALITAPPHPTLMYNDANGAPGEGSRPGVSLQAGFYRGQQNVVNDYWFDGFRRRQDETSIVAGFPADNAASLPFGGLLRGRSEL